MPARVNNPRAADQLRREYDVMGDRLNVSVDDVIVPVAVIADLTAGSGGVPVVRRACASFYQAAVVGEFCTVRIEVPPGFIAIVTRVILQLPATGLCRVHFGSSVVAPANIVVGQYMDGRLRQLGQSPACVVSHDTYVAALAAPYRYIPGNTGVGYESIVEWPFGADHGQWDFIEIGYGTVNATVTGVLEWDEVVVA